MIRLACDKCGRQGQYRRQTLVGRFGPDAKMPDILYQLSSDCPKRVSYSDWCRVRFEK